MTPRTPGWIYVLASTSHPGIIKVGRTSRHTEGRMSEVDRSAYAAFGPWEEVWSKAVADCTHVETAAHRMLANRRVKLNRLTCRELFRVDGAEACRVVEAAAGSLIVARRPLPPLRRQFPSLACSVARRRLRFQRWRRPLTAIIMIPVALWLIGALLHP
jgi:T5orf172 domain